MRNVGGEDFHCNGEADRIGHLRQLRAVAAEHAFRHGDSIGGKQLGSFQLVQRSGHLLRLLLLHAAIARKVVRYSDAFQRGIEGAESRAFKQTAAG
ncbi:hypothetical protein SDC9_97059 [bioreactor metagenome]|uniref:Uncharacterized protein n=1 Tax=bioreactor metagenome TaxID=1076179 RepID=A0A645AAV5_9ZZZZ